jgi:hypothetical protein
MDLVAGDAPAILLALSTDDWSALDDPARFPAHLSLGGGTDPTWLDLFAEAVRGVTGRIEPRNFIDARRELDSPGDTGERTIERVDGRWVGAIAQLADREVDSVAGSWIDLLDEEYGELPREEKPWIRQLASDIVVFARAADGAPDVLFAWSI